MTQIELKKVLKDHKLWLDAESEEGQRANLHNANLYGANLRDANLDFSCFPLWCGGLDMNIDDRQATQLLYHLCRNVLYSKNTSEEFKRLLGSDEILEQANKFHRVNE